MEKKKETNRTQGQEKEASVGVGKRILLWGLLQNGKRRKTGFSDCRQYTGGLRTGFIKRKSASRTRRFGTIASNGRGTLRHEKKALSSTSNKKVALLRKHSQNEKGFRGA